MRQVLILILKISISVILLYLALRGVNFDAVKSRFARIDSVWATAAIAATLVQVVIAALRWRLIITSCKFNLPIADALQFTFISTFFNQTLPSTIGGDGARFLFLRRRGASWQVAAYSVLSDRAIGLVVLAIIVVLSLPWSYRLISNENGRITLMLIDLTALAGSAAFLILGRLSWRWLQNFWLIRNLHGCAKLANQVIFQRELGIPIILASILNHGMTVIIAWCALRAIAGPASFWDMLLLIPPIGLITLLPISVAGWGLREQAMQAAFFYAGLGSADGVAVSILYGTVYFVVGALGGVIWLVRSEKSTKTEASTDDGRSGEGWRELRASHPDPNSQR